MTKIKIISIIILSVFITKIYSLSYINDKYIIDCMRSE